MAIKTSANSLKLGFDRRKAFVELNGVPVDDVLSLKFELEADKLTRGFIKFTVTALASTLAVDGVFNNFTDNGNSDVL